MKDWKENSVFFSLITVLSTPNVPLEGILKALARKLYYSSFSEVNLNRGRAIPLSSKTEGTERIEAKKKFLTKGFSKSIVRTFRSENEDAKFCMYHF